MLTRLVALIYLIKMGLLFIFWNTEVYVIIGIKPLPLWMCCNPCRSAPRRARTSQRARLDSLTWTVDKFPFIYVISSWDKKKLLQESYPHKIILINSLKIFINWLKMIKIIDSPLRKHCPKGVHTAGKSRLLYSLWRGTRTSRRRTCWSYSLGQARVVCRKSP